MTIPSDVSGLNVWYKADSITGLSDGTDVSSWSDSGTNGYTATQSFNQKPSYRTAVVNSLPVLRFGEGDTDDNLESSAPSGLATTTVLAVLRPTSAGLTGRRTYRGGAAGCLGIGAADGKPIMVKQGVLDIGAATTTLSSTVFSVVTAQFSASTSWAWWLNGTADGSGSTSATLDAQITHIGANTGFGGEGWRGDIAELVIYDRLLTSGERASIHTYLSDKYAISVSDYVPSTPAAIPGRGQSYVARRHAANW